jgi:glycosyltransferase involved in cell wall biosynthesis
MRIDFPVRVLMVFHTSGLTGPNKATLSLLEGIDRAKFQIDAASPTRGEFVNRLKDIGVRHIPLIFGRKKDLFTVINLISILGKNRYHILHGHMGRVGPCICLAGKICAVPIIILTEHMSSAEHAWLKNKPLRRFFHHLGHHITNNCLDKVIAVSEDARKNYISRQGISQDKVVTIPNGICFSQDSHLDDAKKKYLKKTFGFDENTIIIGMIGRLIKEKGYQDVIMAVPDILQCNPAVRFLVVGDGPERQNLENLTKELNLTEKIKFLGFRNDADILIQAFDILVQPSWRECHESFGLVLLEAMAQRIAVIASDISPLEEIVIHGQTGLLFEEKNPRDLGEKVISLLKDKDFAYQLSQKGYSVAKEKFNCQLVGQKTTGLYQEVLLSKL